jgi:hypothetical protein
LIIRIFPSEVGDITEKIAQRKKTVILRLIKGHVDINLQENILMVVFSLKGYIYSINSKSNKVCPVISTVSSLFHECFILAY